MVHSTTPLERPKSRPRASKAARRIPPKAAVVGKWATATHTEWESVPRNVLSFDEGLPEQMRPPTSHVRCKKPPPKSLMSPLRLFFVADQKAAPLQMDALADTGAEMEGVAGPECFPPHMVVPAPKPLKITGADRKHIFGGKTGVWVDVQTPCWTARGTRLIRCRRVFIYIVSIGKRIILGFPFPQRYRLAILPNLPYLVPLDLITIT